MTRRHIPWTLRDIAAYAIIGVVGSVVAFALFVFFIAVCTVVSGGLGL